MFTSTATAIVTAARSVSTNRTRGDDDKKFATNVARFKAVKNGTIEKGKMPDPDKREWVLSKEEWESLCDAESAVYLSAKGLNTCKPEDLDQRKKFLADDLTRLLRLCDPDLRVGSTQAGMHFFENIRAFAVKNEVFNDGKAYHVNVALNAFIKKLELELAVVLNGTTFAPDWERDYQKAMSTLPKRIRKAKKALADREKDLETAKKELDFIQKTIGKVAAKNHTKEMDEQVAAATKKVTNIEGQIESIKAAITDLEEKHGKAIEEHSAKLEEERQKAAGVTAPTIKG